MRILTEGTARKFLDNYNGLRNPLSLAYNDNFCGAWLEQHVRDYGFKSQDAMAKACRKLLKTPVPAPKSAFGLFDYTMLPKLNRLLKPHGLRLKQRSNRRSWGDQVEITVERNNEGN